MNGDEGCFSGGAFLDDDGTAYLTFWKFAAKDGSDNGGIAIARSKPPYDDWERIEPIAINGCQDPWGTVDIEIDGETEHIAAADPSNIWKMNGHSIRRPETSSSSTPTAGLRTARRSTRAPHRPVPL